VHKLFLTCIPDMAKVRRTQFMTKNIIELNGNTYDIRTGEMVRSAQTEASPADNKQPNNKQSNQSIDGYSKPIKQQRTDNRPAENSIKKQPHKSQTLMRTSVAKPDTANTAQDAQQAPELQKKPLTNFSRLERASKAVRSAHVQKFHDAHTQNNPSSAHQAPASAKTDQANADPTTQSQSSQQQSTKQAPTLTERAIDNANSHEQTYDGPSQSRISRLWNKLAEAPNAVRYGLAGLLMVGGLAIIGYSSMPYLSVQVASSRSGVSASLPEYKPSGFQLSNNVEYSPDHIALQYDSVSDGRTFSINKEKTDWTSESLRSSFVETKGLYQAVPSNGKTIYIYNESNATWVDGGIWYNIEGSSSLNSDQLLRLANSL